MTTSLIILTFTCYGITGLWHWLHCLKKPESNLSYSALFYALLIIGVIGHLTLAINTAYVAHSFNFSAASMTLWISALVMVMFLLASPFLPIKNLALLITPFTLLSIVFAFLWGDQQNLVNDQTTNFYWHIGFSMAGFTVLSLCVLVSMLFAGQEFCIRKKRWLRFAQILPPIQVMESLLFSLIWLGFILISTAIVLGALVTHANSGRFFILNHHNTLAVLSWLVFLVLLIGRYAKGWRGMQIVKLTLTGFLLLQLGYFGTKLVQETLF